MAIIGKIRERARLLVVVVSLSLFFFIARELFGLNSLGSNKTPIVGISTGKKITLKEFQSNVDHLEHNFSLTYERKPSEQEKFFLRKQVWKKLVQDIVYTKTCKNLDIIVTEDELVDMVQGDHIHKDLQVAFTNPETKKFEKKELISYLQKLIQMPSNHQLQWHALEQNLAMARCQTKYNQLLKHSVFINHLGLQHKFDIDSTSVDIQYAYIPYTAIKDEEITITDSMLKDYFQKHTKDYQEKESKAIRYILFPITASDNDKVAFQKEIEYLKEDFSKVQEDSIFASLHTEADPSLVYLQHTDDTLPEYLLPKTSLKKGAVIGPIITDNVYKLYKVTNIISSIPKKYELHIIEKHLISSEETKDKAFRQADDFLNQIKNKEEFDTKANQENLRIHDAKIDKSSTKLGNLSNARELTRWLYNEAQVGKISNIFEIENNYVIAMVSAHTKPGTSSFEIVHDKIKQKVINEQKAKIVTEKILSILESPLDNIVIQYPDQAKIFNASQLKFKNTNLEGVGKANKTISHAFGLSTKKHSKPIAELAGLVVLEVMQRQQASLPDSWKPFQKQQIKIEQFQQSYQLPKALQKLADTKDYRYKYY